MIAQRAVASPVAISVDIADDVGPVFGVACELEQMMLNLVLTVRAWLPDHGTVAIRVSRVRGAAVIDLQLHGGDRRVRASPRATRTGSLGTVRRVLRRHGAAMENAPGGALRVLIPAP